MLVLNSSNKLRSLSLSLIYVMLGNLFICPIVRADVDTGDLNFKVYNPNNNETEELKAEAPTSSESDTSQAKEGTTADLSQNNGDENSKKEISESVNTDSKAEEDKISESKNANSDNADTTASVSTSTDSPSAITDESKNKILQGYVRVVPSGTKMAIIMDTAVDSDTSQEGDEFSARTAEDLTIDGVTAVPAGSIIRGRIATLNAPRHLNRSGSVALKFDSVTTPDNRQIPLVANLVARGGVVHAKRGLKDIAIDTGTFALPTAVALGIGAVAGHSSSSVGTGGGALIGAAVGAAIGVAILMAKKGKRVDIHPGDELKIELAEDLHMPSM